MALVSRLSRPLSVHILVESLVDRNGKHAKTAQFLVMVLVIHSQRVVIMVLILHFDGGFNLLITRAGLCPNCNSRCRLYGADLRLEAPDDLKLMLSCFYRLMRKNFLAINAISAQLNWKMPALQVLCCATSIHGPG